MSRTCHAEQAPNDPAERESEGRVEASRGCVPHHTIFREFSRNFFSLKSFCFPWRRERAQTRTPGVTHHCVDKPISHKDLPHIRKIGKYTLCALPAAACGYASAHELNPNSPQGEKHEEDNCQDYPGYVFAACVGCGAGFCRRYTCSDMLPKTLPSAIELLTVSGWFNLATHLSLWAI